VFHRVTVHASDRAASERFYDTVLATLGVSRTESNEHHTAWGDFAVAQADADNPVTRRLHIGFGAPSRAKVDEFWRAGTAAGHPDDGSPGPRPQYREDYYGGFLLDPDGNSAEAVHHGALPGDRVVDHLWIRVADVAAAKRFYEGIAADAGFKLTADLGERVRFANESGSFTVLAGEPTEGLDMAF
jgi:catechol 2,3-dioxygenase-like lactoylglutathione lyase family enzyme